MFHFTQFAESKAFITDGNETMTYAQLGAETESFRQNVPKRGLVCCLCKNDLGTIIGYVSSICHGYPLLLLDGSRDREYLSAYIDRYYPEYFWAPSERAWELDGTVIYNRRGYSLIRMSYAHPDAGLPIHENLCLCLTTSGSTGSPKLVRLTLENIKSNAESIAQYLEIDASERPITTLPMYYSFGMSVINSHLIKGATILLTDKTLFSKPFWQFFDDSSPTSIAGVPFTYEMLEKMGFFSMNLPSLKTMIQAGGKLNVEIVKRYVRYATETNRHFIVMYGQTEAGPRMSYLPFQYAEAKPSSIGIAIPGGKFLLYDVEDRVIEDPDIQGELVFEGPGVCMGYAECRADLAKGDENHGVLKTGDVAYRDADGFYYITGRLKRFVKLWGNRINLDAIEQSVKPITPGCACIGDDNGIVIFVEDPQYVDAVSALMHGKMQLDKSQFCVKVIDQIPKASSGKIQYAELKAIHERS